jgi:AbiV family abortive infection protein
MLSDPSEVLGNARRHMATARLLMKASLFREAAFFSLVAAEECAKVKLDDEGSNKDAFRSHPEKQKTFARYDFVLHFLDELKRDLAALGLELVPIANMKDWQRDWLQTQEAEWVQRAIEQRASKYVTNSVVLISALVRSGELQRLRNACLYVDLATEQRVKVDDETAKFLFQRAERFVEYCVNPDSD